MIWLAEIKFWWCLVDHGVLKTELGGHSVKDALDPYNRKYSKPGEPSLKSSN